jgi:tRNA dimethylallyltransferase
MPTSLSKPKIIVIVGATASGKTALSLKLAKKFSGEIVSADSRQIYREMDIGTAKPKLSLMRTNLNSRIFANKISVNSRVAHHLIDIKNPDEPYTVAEYKHDAIRAIRNILKRKKLPILVGGTGLYVSAVADNLEIPNVKPNPTLRKKLEKKIKTRGLESLFEELVKLDPEAAYIVDPKNPRRVIRALEVALTTGKPFSSQRKKGKPLFRMLKIGIAIPKEKLRKRINQRMDKMIKSGLVNEVIGLMRNYGADCPAFDAIGYREIIDYLRSASTNSESDTNLRIRKFEINSLFADVAFRQAIEAIKRNTWRYAKRQMTWFKKDKGIRWIKSEKQALRLVKELLD